MAAPITVVGDALLDVHVTPTRPMRPGGDVPATIRVQSGGQGANVAVRLARRGVPVRLVCRIGADAAGAMVRDALAAEGIEIVDGGTERTGVVVVLLDADRERSMLSDRAALLTATAIADVPLARPEAGWLVVSGYALLEADAAIPAGDEVLRAVVGCALETDEVERWMRDVAALAPHLVVLNLEEARTAAGTMLGADELSRMLGAALGAVVVVTHPGGAAAAVGGDVVRVERPVGRAVDTTGAGDAFAAALVAELRDEPWLPPLVAIHQAMRAATELGTAVTEVVGAQARVPGERGG